MVTLPTRPFDRVIVAIVAALFVIPALLLLVGSKPSPFGFQMYSGYGELSATWTDAAGDVHDVSLDDHLANPRVEVDWTASLPEVLCSRIDGAVSVEVRRTAPGNDERRTLTC